ncbi:MAG: SpoIID/LytB domain-containing protein [Candidatus Cloacimonadales bacterium]
MIKKHCFTLVLLSLFSLLSAYMTLGNEVFLKVLVKLDNSITLNCDGLIFINGKEYQGDKIKINSLKSGKVTVEINRERLTEEAHKFEISVTGNFSLEGNTKQEFSGDLHIREYNDKIAVMNLMNLESYTRYVVVSEIGAGAPLEALKSQAVIARTYAIYMSMQNSNYPWDLRADTYSQVFNTKKKIPINIIEATNATAYMVITYKNKVAFTPFSSYTGGYLANVEDVWGGKGFPYLIDKPDVKYLEDKKMSNYSNVESWIKYNPASAYKDYDKLPNWIKDSYHWEKSVSLTTIESKGKLAKVYSAKVSSRDKSGRISKLSINTASGVVNITSQDKIRSILGGIPSTLAIIKTKGNSLLIEGKGYGHGVGFCQSGGYLKSYAGWDYQKIIKFYYPGCEINNSYFFDTIEQDGLDALFK